MTDQEILAVFYGWIDNMLNVPTIELDAPVTFTKDSNIVTGENFIFEGVLSPNSYIRLNTNNDWMQIASIDSETQLTLVVPYQRDTETGNCYYKSSLIPIIQSTQNSPLPDGACIVIDKPFAKKKMGSGNWKDADGTGKVEYTTHYQATITIEEVEGLGDKLILLTDTLGCQDVRDYFSNNQIAVMRNDGVVPKSFQLGEEWLDSASIDFIIIYTNENSYIPGYIGTVELNGDYNK